MLGQARVPISTTKISGGWGPFLSMYFSSMDWWPHKFLSPMAEFEEGGEGGGRDKEDLSGLEFRSSSYFLLDWLVSLLAVVNTGETGSTLTHVHKYPPPPKKNVPPTTLQLPSAGTHIMVNFGDILSCHALYPPRRAATLSLEGEEGGGRGREGEGGGGRGGRGGRGREGE
jgi:hypothetical protein